MTRPAPPDAATALVALIPGLTRAARAQARSATEADDLVQEALCRVWARHCAGAEIAALPAYARATLRNGLRRRGRAPAPGPLDPESLGNPTAATGPNRVALAEVLTAIAALPEDMRGALVAVVIDGEPPGQVAARLGIAPGTVLSRLGRARARLRRDLRIGAGSAAAGLIPDAEDRGP